MEDLVLSEHDIEQEVIRIPMKFAPVTLRVANEFAKTNSKLSWVRGCKFTIGLKFNGKLIGVGIAGRPIARLLDNGRNLEILRVCVKEGYPDALVKIYSRIIEIAQLMGYKKIVIYSSDRSNHSPLIEIGAAPKAKVKPQGWNRPSRKRKDKDIYKEKKTRWEKCLLQGRFLGLLE